MQIKKIKENTAFLVGVVIAVVMFIWLTLTGISGNILSIYLIVPISAFTGWVLGVLAYVKVSLAFPEIDKGLEYPFPKISLFNHS